MLAAQIRKETRRVEAGERARKARALLIEEARRRGWTIEHIAKLAGISHQAVSKQAGKSRHTDKPE